MAFQHTTGPRQILRNATQDSTSITTPRAQLEESQEWILFSPSQVGSSTDRSSRTAGLSRTSGLESLETAGRSRLESQVLDEGLTEDGELDTLDEGLHAFQEPLYQTNTQQSQGAVLPTHDGLGAFNASSPPVLEQLWQHEQYNPKRKHDGHHRRPSSVQRRLDTIEELEAQANDEKRIRIEKWRLEQSQAMLEEVERETRRQIRRQSVQQGRSMSDTQDLFGSTPKQSDYIPPSPTEDTEDENEPFWRRLTRKFIRDIIGIDEPLLSVILGESLPEDAQDAKPAPLATIPESTPSDTEPLSDDTWRDRLIQRIARELGVCVHAISPHPGAFGTYTSPDPTAQTQTHDYAGLPVSLRDDHPSTPVLGQTQPITFPPQLLSSALTPQFSPTLHSPHHAASWGFDDTAPGIATLSHSHSTTASETTLNLQREREYWERELDVRMVFRFLRERITGSAPASNNNHPQEQQHTATTTTAFAASSGYSSSPEEIGKRTAIIRQHHPLVARAQHTSSLSRPTARSGGAAATAVAAAAAAAVAVNARRPAVAVLGGSSTSCASESVRSATSMSLSRSRSRRRSASGGAGASSANYWDLGGSVGSGSVLASGGLWGEV